MNKKANIVVQVIWFAIFAAVWLWLVPKTRTISDTQMQFWIFAVTFAILAFGGELLNTYKTSANIMWDRALATRLIFRAGIGMILAAVMTFAILRPLAFPILAAALVFTFVYQFLMKRLSPGTAVAWLALVVAAFVIYERAAG